jgi:hypothetical protein
VDIPFTLSQVQEHLQHTDMANFAKVENGIVAQVIVAEQDVIDSGIFGHGWVQTSYNTHGNKHLLNGIPLRGNYAGIGDIYDAENDVFYSQKPFASWVLNKSTWEWKAPVAYPVDGNDYKWDESTLSWLSIPLKTPVETLP